MNADRVFEILSEVCMKVGEPLTETQKLVIIGSLAVLIPKVQYEANANSGCIDDYLIPGSRR